MTSPTKSSYRQTRASMTAIALAMLALPGAAVRAAWAQAPTAEAEQLFRVGKRLMAEGNVAEACEAFEGSQRKAPALSTLLNLANCREVNHQFASAWGHFVEAARLARSEPDQADVYRTAQERAASLESRLSYLIINVPADVQIDGLTIARNGEVVDPAEWNRAIPIDGGEYTIEAKAPAHEPWATVIEIGSAKDKESVDVPRFQPLRDRSFVRTPDLRSPMPARRKVAIGTWVVGGLAVGGAIAFELSGRATYQDAKAATEPARRAELYDAANRKHTLAAVTGGVAATAVGVGLWLWITGAPSQRREPAGVSFVRGAHGASWLVLVGGAL